jgi:PleD family two-component response regulator
LDKLNSFSDNFPELEEKLKNALDVRDYIAFTATLSMIRDILKEIYADSLAQNCQTQLMALTKSDTIRHEKLEAYTTYFLSNVSLLSIDIQIAALEIQKSENEPPSDENTENLENEKSVETACETDKPKNILAVDDQAIHLSALKSHLSDTSYKLTCLSSGEDALRFLQKNNPDLFILDIMMPEMDGFQLALKIRESGQSAPIVFLTGNSSKETVMKALQSGGADFIVKPANKEQVIARISKFI